METTRRAIIEEETQPPYHLLDISTYVTFVVGYLLALFTASKLTWGGCVLLTVASAGWIGVYYYLSAREEDALFPWLITGLALLACSALLAIWLNMGYDWLLPTITAAIVGMYYPLRISLPVTFLLWAATTTILIVYYRRWDPGSQLTLLAPFAFTFIFCFIMRWLDKEYRHSQRLNAALGLSKQELEEAHVQLKAYASQVEELSTTRERNRIAREIHDTLGHYLTILAVQLETATRLEARGDPGLRVELIEARRVAKECLTAVRRSVSELRPMAAAAGLFDDTLHRLVSEFELASKNIEVTVDRQGSMQDLDAELRLALYRCVQEALTNIRKHSNATKVLLRLYVDEKQVELTVLDNGQGMKSSVEHPESGFGLLGVRERVELLRGTTRAFSEPERGWRFEVIVPLAARASGLC